MIKKIIYLMLATFIGIGVGYIEYQNVQYQYTLDLVEEALEDENYIDIAKIFGGLFDSKSLIDYENDGVNELDLVVYAGTNLTQVAYGDVNDPSYYNAFEKSYNFYLFKNNFALASSTNESGVSTNKSGVRFICGDKEFNYYFIANSNINTEMYESNPDSAIDSILYNDRDYLTTFESVGFISINFTESMIEEIADELNGEIEEFQVIDADGKVVYSSNIKLDFKNQFFIDCGKMISEYDETLKAYDNAKTDAEREQIQNDFNSKYESWIAEFEAANYQTYTFGFDEDYLKADNLLLKSFGAVGIYLIIAVMLYILFFHRKMVKKVFCRIFGITVAEEEEDDMYEDTPIEEDMIDVDENQNLVSVLRKRKQEDDGKVAETETDSSSVIDNEEIK